MDYKHISSQKYIWVDHGDRALQVSTMQHVLNNKLESNPISLEQDLSKKCTPTRPSMEPTMYPAKYTKSSDQRVHPMIKLDQLGTKDRKERTYRVIHASVFTN